MDPTRQQRRDELFRQAIDLSPDARPAFLDAACGDDLELRAEVDELLAIDSEADGGPLDGSANAWFAPVLNPGERVDRYVVDALIGEGGMAAVFKGHDPEIDRAVALKVLRPAAFLDAASRTRFLAEIRALGRLTDPGIVRIYDVCEHRGIPVLVLELLAGEDLDALIAANRTGDVREQLRIARELAAALERVHAAGILHRDIKPANVFIETDGRVRLLDFGIAGFEAAGATRASVAGMTPEYASPEQVRGEPPTARSDIYAYGVVLYELFSGSRLYRGQMAATLYRIVNVPIPDGPLRSRVPEPIVELVLRLTAKDPANRPQSFSEVRATLNQIESTSNSVPAVTVGRPAVRPWRAILLIAFFVLAGSLAVFSLTARQNRANPSPVPADLVAPKHAVTLGLVDERGAVLGAGERITVPQQTRFRLRVTGHDTGFLYVFSESMDGATVNVLFPSPASYGGSSRLERNVHVSIPEQSWFEFGDTPGVERVWLLWSHAPIPELEASRRWVNDHNRGVVEDASERAAIQARWRISASARQQGDAMVLSGQEDPLVARLLVEHQ